MSNINHEHYIIFHCYTMERNQDRLYTTNKLETFYQSRLKIRLTYIPCRRHIEL
jgi:hypothetical protein